MGTMPDWSWTDRSTGCRMAPVPSLLLVLAIGAGVGFLGGLLGKGGSAMATPILVRRPADDRGGRPLPATVPDAAGRRRPLPAQGLPRPRASCGSLVLAGLPAAIVGAVLTKWISGDDLVLVTDVLLVGLGVRLLLDRGRDEGDPRRRHLPAHRRRRRPRRPDRRPAGQQRRGSSSPRCSSPCSPAGEAGAWARRWPWPPPWPCPGSLVHLALGHLDLTVVARLRPRVDPLSAASAPGACSSTPTASSAPTAPALVVVGAVFLGSAVLRIPGQRAAWPRGRRTRSSSPVPSRSHRDGVGLAPGYHVTMPELVERVGPTPTSRSWPTPRVQRRHEPGLVDQPQPLEQRHQLLGVAEARAVGLQGLATLVPVDPHPDAALAMTRPTEPPDHHRSYCSPG